VTIEFKEFGVGVKFLPTVMNADNINLKMNIEVSELASQNAAILGVSNSPSTFLIPSLTKRGATSTVELRNGQTIGIAGLISDNLRESVDAMPGLGDVPILGTLFRSQDFISGQTELVIFVTPHLAKPIAKEDMRLPTDKFVAPSDYDFYIMGKLEGKEEESSSPLSSASVIPSASQDVKQFGHNF
jgi:pilus assembly protein CpaC